MAHFVSNLVAIATGVGRGRICLASFYSPTPKTPCYTQRSRGYLGSKTANINVKNLPVIDLFVMGELTMFWHCG